MAILKSLTRLDNPRNIMAKKPLFLAPLPINLPSQPPPRTCNLQRTKMSIKGFGKTPAPRPESANQKRRTAASKRYDEMASSGMPEYTIWMRLKEGGTLSLTEKTPEEDEEKMPWLPVGCIAVARSATVASALKEAEGDLWQGAERLYPKLKGENRDNVEFGCQLRQFPDEEIRLVEDVESEGFGGWMKRFWRKVQNPLNVG